MNLLTCILIAIPIGIIFIMLWIYNDYPVSYTHLTLPTILRV